MKTIVTIVIVIALAFLGYWYYGTPRQSSNELLVSTGTSASDAAVGQKIITLLSEMQNITIDQSIFSAATFQSLQDFGVDIQPELIGRHDPFAPIGFEQGGFPSVSPVATTTAKTTSAH